jgi:hypothetical protein
MLPVPTSGSNDWARAGVAMKIRTAAVVRTLSFHSPIRRYLEPTIALPDARPSCCCEIALATTDFAFNSPHLTTDRRVQHPTLNDCSATHVFVAAIGTTAFLRFSASGRMQTVRQLCGRSLSALGHYRPLERPKLMCALPPKQTFGSARRCPLWAGSGHSRAWW